MFLRMFWNLINSLPVKRGGSLSFLMIFTFDVPELLDMISRKYDFYPMSFDNLSIVSQNVLKFYHQLTSEETRIPFFFDDFHFCRSRVIGLDITENRMFTLCRMITWVVFLRMFEILLAAYRWRDEDPFHFWRFSLLPFQSYWTWYDGKKDFYTMSYDNLSSVSQNVLKFYQQLTGEERRVPFIFGRNNQ